MLLSHWISVSHVITRVTVLTHKCAATVCTFLISPHAASYALDPLLPRLAVRERFSTNQAEGFLIFTFPVTPCLGSLAQLFQHRSVAGFPLTFAFLFPFPLRGPAFGRGRMSCGEHGVNGDCCFLSSVTDEPVDCRFSSRSDSVAASTSTKHTRHDSQDTQSCIKGVISEGQTSQTRLCSRTIVISENCLRSNRNVFKFCFTNNSNSFESCFSCRERKQISICICIPCYIPVIDAFVQE